MLVFLFRENLPHTQPCDEPHSSCHLVNAERSGNCMVRPSAASKRLGDPGTDTSARKHMSVHCSSKESYVHLSGRKSIAGWRTSSRFGHTSVQQNSRVTHTSTTHRSSTASCGDHEPLRRVVAKSAQDISGTPRVRVIGFFPCIILHTFFRLPETL